MFLNGGDALSGLGDAEGEHGEVVVVEQHHAVVEDVNFLRPHIPNRATVRWGHSAP